MKPLRIAAIGAALVASAAIITIASRHDQSEAASSPSQVTARPVTLSAEPGTYLGAYVPGVPGSYANLAAFTAATRIRPNVVVYYSGWQEPFRTSFAERAAKNGAVPLVQIEPTGISLAAIASGRYDEYLLSFAQAVRSYRRAVILGFAHEMNGMWYSWSNRHSSPAAFVAAWRHVVTLFRAAGAENVTWMWTVNIMQAAAGIPNPGPWWPGSSYVTWVGIDGYYTGANMTFASLFGPTIVAIRTLTDDPILIAETGVAAGAHQPALITDLFAGIRNYQILGLVWFDAVGRHDWRLISAPAITAFRQGAQAYHGIQS